MTDEIKKPKLAELCIDIRSGQAVVTKDGTIEFNDCGENLTLDEMEYIVCEAKEFIKYRESRNGVDNVEKKEETSMIFEKTLDLKWTDGDNASSSGYFDGAGEFNKVLVDMFASDDGLTCHSGSRGTPFYTNVMGHIEYGSKVKCIVRLEVCKE